MRRSDQLIDAHGMLDRGEKLGSDISGYIPFHNSEYPRFNAMVIIYKGALMKAKRFGNNEHKCFQNIIWLDNAEPKEMADALKNTQESFQSLLNDLLL